LPHSENAKYDDNLLTVDEVTAIFGQIQTIIAINKNFFTELKKIRENWDMFTKVGSLFIKSVPMFKIYIQYVNNYNNAVNLLTEAKKRKAFRKFLGDALSTPIVTLATLEDYLITPVQRIPRYSLLLNELKKCTDQNHPDYQDILKSYEKMGEITEIINEKKREVESVSRLISLQENIIFNTEEEKIDIAIPARHILAESGIVDMGIGENEFFSQIKIFLFSDIILITKQKKKSYVYLHSYPTPSIKEFQAPTEHLNIILFNIEYNTELILFTIAFEELGERSIWVKALQTLNIEEKGIKLETDDLFIKIGELLNNQTKKSTFENINDTFSKIFKTKKNE